MHYRALLTFGLLAAMALAGCVEDASQATGQPLVDTTVGQSAAHPGYNYPTNGQLPVADDAATRVVAADGTIQWFRPAQRPLPATLNAIEPLAEVQAEAGTAAGIAVHGPLAVFGNRGSTGGMAVVDISDPMHPVATGFSADTPVRDADFIQYPDGRLVVVTTAGGAEQYVTDVTDPADPFLVSTFATPHRNHNIAVVPGTPLVYNSGSNGLVDIMDYSVPEEPVFRSTFYNAHGCHDITFFVTEDTQRAYCAAYAEAQIWDISDPVYPQMVNTIAYPTLDNGIPVVGPNTDPRAPVVGNPSEPLPLSFAHLAMPNHDGTVLIVGDEFGGGSLNGCDVYADTPAGTASGPAGNLWFYDMSNETDVQLRGWVSPDALSGDAEPTTGAPNPHPEAACTSHFGRVIEDTGFLVMAFYTSGILLIDFNDLDNPRIVHSLVQSGTDVWDVQYHQGYLVTGDIGRGMDILTLA